MGGGNDELKGPDLGQGIPFSDLAPNAPFVGHANGENVLVVRLGDEVHAVGASCTHYGGPLAEGLVVDGTVRCPWHHACFDLRTGRAIGAPALSDIPCWIVEQRDGLVKVRSKKSDEERPKPSSSPSSVVIIGAGAAAAACTEMLRKEGYSGPIAMLGAEAPGPVDRPNLSKDYLAGTAPEEWIPLGTRDRYTELKVDLTDDDPVVAIDPKAKTIATKSGRTLSYGALLYATGAEPSRLPLPGADAANVFTLRSLADARAIIARATSGKRAVVVGSSFIGLEVAASLVARGVEVHVVGPDKVPLARILGEDAGRFVRGLHENKGVRFHLERTPKSISASSVELSDGTSLACDFVVLGVGVKPRVALAEKAGIKIDNGVVVDDHLRTSIPEIWAAGDVARYPDAWLAESIRVEHWVVAERQGQAVARAMLGNVAPYRDVPFFWSAHYDVTISYVGHAASWDAIDVRGSLEAKDATLIYRGNGRVNAVVTVNRDLVSLRVEAAMQRGDRAAVEEAVRH